MVPIVIHSLYDFVTIFATWLFAGSDINRGTLFAEERYQVVPDVGYGKFQEECRMIFDMMDTNKDGVVDKSEFVLAKRLMGYVLLINYSIDSCNNIPIRTGPLLYGNPILSGDLDVLFAKYDINGDGQIDFDEFVGLIEEDLENFPLRKPTIPE